MHQLPLTPPPPSSLHVSPSPSFSSYSSETLADIAARVINELRQNPHQNDAAVSDVLEDDHDSLFQPWEDKNENENENDNNHDQNDDQEEEDEFEFTFSRHQNTSPISADDIFYNGQIKPMYMYPLFGNPLTNDINNGAVSSVPVPHNKYDDDASATVRRRLPLRMLMFEDSCSSENDSVVDEDNSLETVPEGTYCVWNPNNAKVAAMDRNNKKSNSTGTSSSSSSKRWKIRELLLRSHSDGKGNKNRDGDGDNKKPEFVFGVTSKRTSKVAAVAKAGSGDGYGGASVERDGKSGKKSVFPYKQELIGIFANVNGVGRNLHPF